jgi:hypothetical protein
MDRIRQHPRISAGIALVVVLFAVGVANSARKKDNKAVAQTPSGLRAIGAVRTIWARGQTADGSFDPGSAYDPASGLGDGTAAVYTAVLTTDGRIQSFDHNFPNGTSLASARQILARKDLPADAHRVWFKNLRNQCAIEQYRSADLVHAGQPGAVNVEYTSNSGGTSFTPATVNDATLLLIDPDGPTNLSC